jgi:type I restriction enzyme S subunit
MSNTVPKGWCRLNLPDVCYFQEGPGLRNWQYTTSGYPFINIRCIKDGYLDLSNVQYISSDEANQKYKHFFLNEGDYVLSSSGTLGRMAKIRKKDLPLMLNTSVIRFRSSDDKTLYHDYLPHYLQSQVFVNQIAEESQGSAQVNFGPTHLKLVECTLPPVPEQQKIAAILSSVDDVIEKTRAQIDKLKDLKTGMMQELLTRGVGSGGAPHTEFEDTPVGTLPSEWNVELLDKVAARGSGHTPSKSKSEYWNAGLDWVSLSDTNKLDRLYINTTAKQISELGIQNSSAVIHPPGTVVLSRDAGIGKSGIITKKMAVSQHFIAWQCSDRLHNHFLYYVLQFWKPKFEAIAMGSTIKTIGLPFFKKLHVPVPPISEQKTIAGTLQSIDLKIFSIERKLNATMAVKKALMQDLLTGKVRVNVEKEALSHVE